MKRGRNSKRRAGKSKVEGDGGEVRRGKAGKRVWESEEGRKEGEEKKEEKSKKMLKSKIKQEKEEEKILKCIRNFLSDLLKKYKNEIRAAWLVPIDKEILFCILLNDLIKTKTRKIFNYIMKKKGFCKNIKIYIYFLSEYFQNIMQNKEEYFNEIKRAMIIYDTGLIKPIKILIEQGKIKKTKEAMISLIMDVGNEIREIRNAKLDILSKIYSAVIDAAQSPLLLRGYTVMIPSTIPNLLKIFLKSKEITPSMIQSYEEIYSVYKDYEHGKISDISGKKLDYLIKKAEKFIDDMQELARKILQKGI